MNPTKQQKHAHECHVRWLLLTKTRSQCVHWLNGKPKEDRAYYRAILNEQQDNLRDVSNADRDRIVKGQLTMKEILARKKLLGESS